MVEQGTEKKSLIEYHYGFYAAIQFEYEAAHAELTFLQEYDLGKEPVRLVMLVITNGEPSILNDPIGRFFRKHNVIEYKSPDDALSINDFYKAQGYACIYKEESPMVDVFKDLFHDELTASRDEGILIGEERARRAIMQNLIDGGMSPDKAAAATAIN